MKKLILILLLWSFFTKSFSQMAVVDVVGNKLSTMSVKMQAIEKQTSVATKVVLTAMSGDITGSLEALNTQNEILKNSKELRSTLGDIVKASKVYHEWENRLKVTKKLFEGTQSAMDELFQEEKLSKETVESLNYSLSKVRKLTDASNDIFRAATDTEDEISRLLRLEKLQESDQKMEEAIRELQALQEKINSLKKGFAFRYELVNMGLPPFNPNPAKSFLSPQPQLTAKQKKQYFSSIGKGIEKAISNSPYKAFFKLIINYIDILFIIMVASVAVYIQRSKGWGNTFGLIKTVFELLLGYTLLKVIVASMI
ncbi:MAG: hypothetical protein KTR26_16905 [Flammeovirgaceae bacterium]|nr:hypothetical protein [Flammeovirgaceae bacterium]